MEHGRCSERDVHVINTVKTERTCLGAPVRSAMAWRLKVISGAWKGERKAVAAHRGVFGGESRSSATAT